MTNVGSFTTRRRSWRRRQADFFHEGPVARVGMEEVEDRFVLQEDDARGVLTIGLFEKAQGLLFATGAPGVKGTPIWREVFPSAIFGIPLPGDICLPVGDSRKTSPRWNARSSAAARSFSPPRR